MMDTIESGNAYRCLHYVDFTGDGWVNVATNVSIGNGNVLPAQSLVAAVDFFPYCEQTEILDNPANDGLWRWRPLNLADTRFLANIVSHPELRGDPKLEWDTVTALVPKTIDDGLGQTAFTNRIERRVTYLTDGANGVFAPGWDTSFDTSVVGSKAVQHLTNYGLGSPFPEDAKLCAALSSFWPAVAPDVTRSFWPAVSPTVVPLLDHEIGANGNATSWDGQPGPQIRRNMTPTRVRYKRIEYVDYTAAALDGEMDFHRLASIDALEYQSRVQKHAKARDEVKKDPGFRHLLLASYTQLDATDPEIQNLNPVGGNPLVGTVHKFIYMNAISAAGVPNEFQFIDIAVDAEKTLYVDEAETVHVV